MSKYLVIAALAVAGLFIFGFGSGKSSLVLSIVLRKFFLVQ